MLWQIPTWDLVTTFGVFASLAYICGWICDSLLSRVAFGPLGNGSYILIGAYVGMFTYNLNGYFLFRDVNETYLVIGGSAFIMLMFMVVVKRFALP